jgi:hypothetical protein
MRSVALLLAIALAAPAMGEDFLDDFPAPIPDDAPNSTLSADIQTLSQSVFALMEISGDTKRAVESIADRVAVLEGNAKLIGVQEVPSVLRECQCNCECPTLDQIRQVFREELDRVSVTVKAASGETRSLVMPLTANPSQPIKRELQPGDRVVAIEGVAVQPFNYMSPQRVPITRYSTPQFDLRVMEPINTAPVGAVIPSGNARSNGTCRVVNGVRFCN